MGTWSVKRRTGTLIAAVLIAAAGCGGGAPRTAGVASEGAPTRTLNIYVSGQLRYWADAVRAQQLAVEDVDGRVGPFKIRVIVHDESSPDNDNTDPQRVRRNAEVAARDPDAIAYVGDVNSGSTAISAPILNRAGLLQVTPSSTYVGLTRAEGAGPGEPQKYQPTGHPTLARVIPADHIQARAVVIYARELGVTRLGVAADESLYGQGLATLVLAAARDLGVDAIEDRGGSLEEQGGRVTAAGADAVYFATCGAPGEMVELVEGLPSAKVFAGDCYAGQWPPQVRLSDRFFVTAPGGGLEETPTGGRFYERWHASVGTPADDKLLFAYESMSAVLAAIERAGPDGGNRAAVLREFFATRDRDSIVGRYSIDRHGDTTLRSYGGYDVHDGKLQFDRVLDTGG